MRTIAELRLAALNVRGYLLSKHREERDGVFFITFDEAVTIRDHKGPGAKAADFHRFAGLRLYVL